MLWGMDGISSAPVEVTMPFGNLAIPDGVIVHRSRRQTEPAEVRGIPVSGPERTLLECSLKLGPMIIGKALDSALRMNITNLDRMWMILVKEGGRGVPGTKRLRFVLTTRIHDEATDSGAEYELLFHMQRAGIPLPELHFEFVVEGRRIIVDLYWPVFRKAVEVDGIDAHSSADRLDDDLNRQNLLLELGVELRRFSARRIRREPELVIAQIRRFLEA
jgi:very-short-patch-repair endonuclease